MPRAMATCRVLCVGVQKTGMPNGSALINGCFASLVLLLQIPLGEGSDVFWVFFSMNVVFLLMSYIPMFPAFWRLRKHDNRSRVFRAPFEGKVLAVALAIPWWSSCFRLLLRLCRSTAHLPRWQSCRFSRA